MRIKIKELPVTKYTTNVNIYSLRDEIHDDGEYWFINHTEGYDKGTWTLKEAIADYLSPDAEERRMMAFYRAWGFWD